MVSQSLTICDQPQRRIVNFISHMEIWSRGMRVPFTEDPHSPAQVKQKKVAANKMGFFLYWKRNMTCSEKKKKNSSFSLRFLPGFCFQMKAVIHPDPPGSCNILTTQSASTQTYHALLFIFLPLMMSRVTPVPFECHSSLYKHFWYVPLKHAFHHHLCSAFSCRLLRFCCTNVVSLWKYFFSFYLCFVSPPLNGFYAQWGKSKHPSFSIVFVA